AGGGGRVNADEVEDRVGLSTVVRAIALVALALVVWEVLARSGLTSRLLVPSLASIGSELGRLAMRTDSFAQAAQSLGRALSGFALAALVGVTLGVVMGRSRLAAACVDPILTGTFPVPKIALFPIFIFLFGIGSLSKVALVFLECLYPIVLTTYAGS